MVSNTERAEWAKMALQAFADECACGAISEETVTDLLCDVGHFAQQEFGLKTDDIVKLFSTAIGAWLAEARSFDGEPWDNEIVKIVYSRKSEAILDHDETQNNAKVPSKPRTPE